MTGKITRSISLAPYARALPEKWLDQVPHELFHLFTYANMNGAEARAIRLSFIEGTAEAAGLWRTLEVSRSYPSSQITTLNLDGNQNLMYAGVNDRNASVMKGTDNTDVYNPSYTNGAFYLSLTHNAKKYGRTILFKWLNKLNEMAQNNNLISTLNTVGLLEILNAELNLLDAQNEKLDLSKLYFLFTLDVLHRRNFFNASPEPYTISKDIVMSKTFTVEKNTFQPKSIPMVDSLTQPLSAKYYEIKIDQALLSGPTRADIVVYLDTINLSQQEVLTKFARYVRVAAVKKVGSNYQVVADYPLIDQLTINGQKKFVKIINPGKINFEKLILIVPNTTFGRSFQQLNYAFKMYRGPEVFSIQNTATPGRVRFIGDGFGPEAEVYFKGFDAKYVTAYGKVTQELNSQSIEIDLPSNIVNGNLFIKSQGSTSNEKAYIVDLCKKEFSVQSSIKEHLRCIY